jgi:DNA-directed RNA polymerase subunit M/transcription elongation factor TFIIS
MKGKVASILIAACAVSTGVCAQNVYRCGTTYSNTPCAADAHVVDVQDGRTPEQRAQVATGIQKEAKLAKKLEKDRFQREAQERAALRQAQRRSTPHRPQRHAAVEVVRPVVVRPTRR